VTELSDHPTLRSPSLIIPRPLGRSLVTGFSDHRPWLSEKLERLYLGSISLTSPIELLIA
jgi:hypothetical protein